MGSVLPANNVEKIEFCEQHVATWTTNAVAMGSSAASITAWAAQVIAARAAFNAQKTAQDAAKDATITYQQALTAMTNSTSDIIKSVKSKAAVSGDGIYVLASIPAPAAPSPKGPPGQPIDLKVALTQTGALDMAWTCPNPPGTSGTIYNVFRSLTGAVGSYAFIGGTGVREFTDESAPSAPILYYQIQAVRSTSVGPWATFTVYMGVGSNGAAMIKSIENTSAKIAA